MGYAKAYYAMKHHENTQGTDYNMNVRELNWLVTYISIYTKLSIGLQKGLMKKTWYTVK